MPMFVNCAICGTENNFVNIFCKRCKKPMYLTEPDEVDNLKDIIKKLLKLIDDYDLYEYEDNRKIIDQAKDALKK